MKKLLHITVIVVLVMVSLAFAGRLWIHYLKAPIFKVDHRLLLMSARQLIAERSEFPNARNDAKANPGDPVFLTSKALEDERIPPIIQKLRPKYVALQKDRALLCISAWPRVYVLAFPEDVEQYGTVKLIDGLWYFNGRRSTSMP